MTTMPRTARVMEGRPAGTHNKCESCGIRLTIGEPRISDAWAQRLSAHPLTDRQIDLLLMGAVEYGRLSQKADELESAVAFLDWLTPEATGRFSLVHPEFDGHSVNEGEGRQSTPFPLPYHRRPGPKAGPLG